MTIDLETFYIIISPEQDNQGKILINRKSGELRNWYFCSQEFDKENKIDNSMLEITNQARIYGLAEAFEQCGYENNFKLGRPKSCNEKAAKKYMTNRIVIVLDNFKLEEITCDIHNGLLCRNIDDDPRIWKKVKWGKKYIKKQKSVRKNTPFNTMADKMPDKLKSIGVK